MQHQQRYCVFSLALRMHEMNVDRWLRLLVINGWVHWDRYRIIRVSIDLVFEILDPPLGFELALGRTEKIKIYT